MTAGKAITLVHVEADRETVRHVRARVVDEEFMPVEITTGCEFDPSFISGTIVIAYASEAAISDPAFIDVLDLIRGERLYLVLTEVTEIPLGITATLVDGRSAGTPTGEAAADHLADIFKRLASGAPMLQLIQADELLSESARRRQIRHARSRPIALAALTASLVTLPFMAYASFMNSYVVESEGLVSDTTNIILLAALLIVTPAASILASEHSWLNLDRTNLYRTIATRDFVRRMMMRLVALFGATVLIAWGLWEESLSHPERMQLIDEIRFAVLITVAVASLLTVAVLSPAFAFVLQAPRRLYAWTRRGSVFSVSL